MNKQAFHCLLASIILIFFAACSSGGGETGTGQTVSVGVITGFGSVFVNGVEFETNASTITLDGNSSLETDLKVGMLVTLTGDINVDGTAGNALSISYNDNVEGMVLANTVSTNNQLVILGQVVVIDNFDTIFESKIPNIQTIDQIQVNNIVEVSGHTSGNGVIYATRIELKRQSRAINDEVELEGLVSQVTSSTFYIGSLEISYTDNLLGGVILQNGDFVKVSSVNDLNIEGQLLASAIKIKEQYALINNLKQDKEVELEGVITAVESETQFSLNGQPVIYNSTTDFKNANSVLVGKKVKVEGVVNQNQQIFANKIEFESENKSKTEGLITAVDIENRTVTVFDDVIYIINSTTVKDERDGIEDNARHFFNFSNLSVGDSIEVSFYLEETSNRLIASKLELQDTSEDDNSGSGGSDESREHEKEWEIRNIILSYDVTTDSIVMLNRTIDISNISGFDGESAVGKLVEAKGIIVNMQWVATDLEIQAEDENVKDDDD